MKTVLVTGGLGFIFSHCIEILLEKGYKVVNIDKITYASNTDFHPKNPNYTFIKEDIKDLADLPHCDYIIHAASESHVDASIANSDPFVNSNMLGTYKILELLKEKKLWHMKSGYEYKDPVFVHISTDECLGDIKKGFFREDAQLNPSNPYAATKSAAESLVKAWGRTYGIPYRITRTTNNYGYRQHPEKLIPHAITQLIKGEKIKIHGDGSYIRNWIYVKDNCDAVIRVMEKGKNNEIYHISSDEEYSVLEIVQMIANKFDKEVEDVIEFIPNRTGQDIRYGLNCNKIRKKLGWKQQYKLSGVLDEMIAFYTEKYK